MSKSRAWCFTLNNPKGDETYALHAVYTIVGDEVGDSGTPHHQGYIYFENARTFTAIQKMLPKGAHIERALGNAEQNREYCSKDGKIFYEDGVCPKQGKRTDFQAVREALAAGERMSDIVEWATSFQSVRSAEMILKYKETRRNWVPEVLWFWGGTGTGKTRQAFELAPEAWVSGRNLKWWDGYDAHEDVIFDDFRGDFCTYHELLRILDRYPYRIEVKGGSRQLLAKRIIITSPVPPAQVYRTVEDVGQLLRRITSVSCFDTDTDVGGVILDPPISDAELLTLI